MNFCIKSLKKIKISYVLLAGQLRFACGATLILTGEVYKDEAMRIDEMVTGFQDKATIIETEMNAIRNAIETVYDAVEQNTMGIGNITATSVKLAEIMEQNKLQAEENLTVTKELENEIQKFVY